MLSIIMYTFLTPLQNVVSYDFNFWSFQQLLFTFLNPQVPMHCVSDFLGGC
jgi:hypothetical protein